MEEELLIVLTNILAWSTKSPNPLYGLPFSFCTCVNGRIKNNAANQVNPATRNIKLSPYTCAIIPATNGPTMFDNAKTLWSKPYPFPRFSLRKSLTIAVLDATKYALDDANKTITAINASVKFLDDPSAKLPKEESEKAMNNIFLYPRTSQRIPTKTKKGHINKRGKEEKHSNYGARSS